MIPQLKEDQGVLPLGSLALSIHMGCQSLAYVFICDASTPHLHITRASHFGFGGDERFSVVGRREWRERERGVKHAVIANVAWSIPVHVE
jgi:hypothetical protein